MNNALKLRGFSYQNPKEIYPIAVFYESDSRDNLEQNLNGEYSLGSMISATSNHVKSFLGGDEMFLESLLDGSHVLGPLTDRGWNIYNECPQEQKKEVGANGLRTDLKVTFNRQHPESLVPSIPVNRIVFCILHALARIVEKLLMSLISLKWPVIRLVCELTN